MYNVKIDASREKYNIYLNEKFMGEMTPTQLVLFYVLYKTEQSCYNDEIIEIYSSALYLNKVEFLNVIYEVKQNFEPLLHQNIDFSEIDIKHALSMFDNTVYLGRIRSFNPTTIAIAITNSCFCQCLYCYAKECGTFVSDNRSSQLEINAVNTIFEYANACGVKVISITGGDPLSHPHFWDILELCKKYRLKVNFSTKKILSSEDIEKLINYKEQIDYMQVSIDTMYVSEEQMMLDQPRCEKMIAAFTQLVERSEGILSLTVNSVLTKYNIDNILELTSFLMSLGNIKHTLSPYTFNFSTNNSAFFPSEEQYNTLRRKIAEFPMKDILSYSIVIGKEKELDSKVICRAGINALVINYDGNVYVCERFCADKNFSIGNIFKQSLVEIWNSDKAKKYANPDKELFGDSICGNCVNFEYCVKERGICYVHSYIINNKNIYSPDSFCIYNEQNTSVRLY